ncbi:MAG: PilZ domain-containing protein [Acidobacteriia bacterium]|nr:PilZ domain-containing protein [Terriglobia bacterium]
MLLASCGFVQALIRRPSEAVNDDISSNGILFRAPQPLRVGMEIELSIAWPTHLHNGAAPKVWVTGRTVRVQGVYTAVRILRYEYRVPGMGYEWNFDPQDRAAHAVHGSEPRC